MKKMKKDAEELITTGAVLGLGSNVISKVGGSTAGVAAYSGFMPMIATAKGAETALKSLKKMKW